jgi:hypothetical protein
VARARVAVRIRPCFNFHESCTNLPTYKRPQHTNTFPLRLLLLHRSSEAKVWLRIAYMQLTLTYHCHFQIHYQLPKSEHSAMPPFGTENPEPGSGGLTVTEEMHCLIAKPGLLHSDRRGEGDGQRLRALYQDR